MHLSNLFELVPGAQLGMHCDHRCSPAISACYCIEFMNVRPKVNQTYSSTLHTIHALVPLRYTTFIPVLCQPHKFADVCSIFSECILHILVTRFHRTDWRIPSNRRSGIARIAVYQSKQYFSDRCINLRNCRSMIPLPIKLSQI